MIKKNLQLSHIVKNYGGVLALDDVSATFDAGNVYGLVGENGAGKSTLMKVLNGSVQKDQGTISIDGKEVEISSPNDAQKLGIGMVYQELHLMPDLTVTENLYISHLSDKKSGVIDWKKLKMQTVQTFKEKLNRAIDPDIKVGDLKVADQQVVAIMRALVMNCRLIIFDEPTSALSVQEIRGLLDIIEKLRRQDYIIVFISHKLDEVIRISDRIVAMRNGRKIDEIDNSDANGKISDAALSELIAGRKLVEKFPKKKFERGEELLRVEHLSIRNKLHDISFTLYKGEILGFAGLLGAGKTEVAGALFGTFGNKKDTVHGKVYLKGKELSVSSPRKAIAAGFGLLPESRAGQGLLVNLPIGWNVSLANLSHISKGGIINRQEEQRKIQQIVEEIQIKCASTEHAVSSLSGGNQQKVALARWVSTQGIQIVIFDEPTRGIDVGAKVEIYNLMNKLVDRGIGVIIVSSEIDEVRGMADRVMMLAEGKIIQEVKPEEYTDQELYDILMDEAGGL